MLNEDELLVNGYVRQCQHTVIQLIPDVLIWMIYEYFVYGLFGKHSSNIWVHGDDKQYATALTGKRCCVYGYDLLDSTSDKLITYEIKFNTRLDGTVIGITNNSKNTEASVFNKDSSHIYYGYDNEGDKYSTDKNEYGTEYGREYGKRDIVKMELNLSKRTIEFYVNDECQGIAFDDIKVGDDIKYKLVIEFWVRDGSCKIINFTEKQL